MHKLFLWGGFHNDPLARLAMAERLYSDAAVESS